METLKKVIKSNILPFDGKRYLSHIFEKIATNIDSYTIMYKDFSLKGKVIERLRAFCEFFNITLELNNNMTFKRGSYAKIKETYINARYPHWFTKKGTNKIWKIFRPPENHGYKFEQDMINIDASLSNLRRDGHTLDSDDDSTIKEKFQVFLNNISQTNHPDIEYDISDKPLVYSRRSKWVSESIGNSDAYIQHKQRLAYDIPTITLPLFCNIKVKLPDTNIVFHESDGGSDVTVYKTIDWGDLVVYMTFPIQTVLEHDNGSREKICIHTDLFPNYPGTMHPFVSREWGGYAHGNTCFGSFPIERLILEGKLMEALTHMQSWANSYDVHRTSPINNARRTYYSLNSSNGALSNDSDCCDTAFQYYKNETVDAEVVIPIVEAHLAQFCDDCICSSDCIIQDRMLEFLTARSPLEDLALLEDFVRREWCNMFPEGPAIKEQQSEILAMFDTFRNYIPHTITVRGMTSAAKLLFLDLSHIKQSGFDSCIVDTLHNLHVTDCIGRAMRTSARLNYRHNMCVENGTIVEDIEHGHTIIESLKAYQAALNVAYLVSLLIVTGKVGYSNLSALGEQYTIGELYNLLYDSCKTNAYISKMKIELPFPDEDGIH